MCLYKHIKLVRRGFSRRFFIVFVGRRMSIPARITDSKADHFSSHDERESTILYNKLYIHLLTVIGLRHA